MNEILDTTFAQLMQSEAGKRDLWPLRFLTGDWHKFSLSGDQILKWGQTLNRDPERHFQVPVTPLAGKYHGFGSLQVPQNGEQNFRLIAFQRNIRSQIFTYQLHLADGSYRFQTTSDGVRPILNTPYQAFAPESHFIATTALLAELNRRVNPSLH